MFGSTVIHVSANESLASLSMITVSLLGPQNLRNFVEELTTFQCDIIIHIQSGFNFLGYISVV